MAPPVAENVLAALVCSTIVIIYSGKTQFALQKVSEIIHRKPGCNPMPSVGNVTLHYFAGRGRGEAIRMLMANAEVPWTETRFTKETWPEAKEAGISAGIFTFGQVPAITTSEGHHLVQSIAILHHLGRSVGYDCDCSDIHWCEQIALGTEDITQRMSKLVYNKEDFTVEKINEYLDSTLPTWLLFLEKIAPVLDESAKELTFASGRLTWIDFLVFNVIEKNYDFEAAVSQARGTKVDILENFPNLKRFYEEFQNRPNLHAYLNKKERPPFKLPFPIILPKEDQ